MEGMNGSGGDRENHTSSRHLKTTRLRLAGQLVIKKLLLFLEIRVY